MDKNVVITSIGMTTSIGDNATQTCSSIRADINHFAEPEHYFFCQQEDPESGEPDPLICAPINSLDFELEWTERILHMLQGSMDDLFANSCLRREDFKEAAFFLTIPPSARQGVPEDITNTIIPELDKRAPCPPFRTTKVFSNGHAACYKALKEAIALLQEGAAKYCLIGGVDSYLDHDTLEELDEVGRLKSDRNRDSFIPGEAASVFLIELEENAIKRKQQPLATIKGAASSFEENGFFSQKPCLAKGLTRAISEAIGELGDTLTFEWVVCDLNGESFRSKEWGIVYSRLGKYFPDFSNMHHPADCLGDIGSASAPLNIALAARAFQHNYAPAETALIWGASDAGERGATILSKYKNAN